jgi:hypothetical protein
MVAEEVIIVCRSWSQSRNSELESELTNISGSTTLLVSKGKKKQTQV